MKKSSPLFDRLRRHVTRPVTLVLTVLFPFWAGQVQGATFYWDPDGTAAGNNASTGAGLGGTGTWNTTSSFWWDGVSTDGAWANATSPTDTAVFAGAAGTVTLGAPITVGGLTLNVGGYSLSGSTLTLTPSTGLTSPVIAVNNNGFGTNGTTISSTIAGTSGFTKTGNGTLRLSADNSATLSGDVAIKGGNVVITNANQLGSLTGNAISVTGIANTGNPGFTGGALILQGTGNGAGVTTGSISLGREVSISGRGPGASNSTGSLVSIGYNTLAGGITLGSVATEARAWATHGATTVSGTVNLGTGNAQLFYGNGNWIISGQVTGTEVANDRFVKTGNLVSTTMWLQNANNNFAQAVRIDSGTVRVQTGGALGQNTGTGQIDLNNGTIEIRTDAVAGFAGRTARVRNNTTGTFFIDHDITGSLSIGSSLQNQTLAMGALIRDTGANAANFTINGRNGYNISFTSATPTAGDYRGITVTNNSSGTVTLTGGNVWNANAGTASTYTVTGGGETIITGAVVASGSANVLTKSGSGTFTLGSTAATTSTFTGNANANDGTLVIRSINALNPTSTSAGRVVFGGGALSFIGVEGTGAGETWTNKIADLNNANSYILADQSGSAPTALILPNNFAVTNTAAKTLNLGGSAPASIVNQVSGLITNGVNLTNVLKFGTDTWEIAAPTNYGTSSTINLAATGATASTTVTLASGSTAGLFVGQPISGAGISFGATITQILDGTTLILSSSRAANTAAGAAAIGTANGITTALTTTAASTGTTNPVITVASTVNLVPGQKVTSTNLPASQNWYIRDITSATTVTLVSGTGASLAAGAVLSGEVITPQLSINFGGNLTITNGIFRANSATATSDIINSTSNLIFNTDSVTLMGNAGGTFNYVGFATGSSTEVLGRLVPTAGHGVISITNGTGADTLTFLDIGTRGAGATLDYQPGIGTINFNGTAPAGTNGIQSGYATFNGLDWVSSGATVSQYTGYTAWSGSLAPTSTLNYSISGAASTTAVAATVNSLKLTGGAALTLNQSLSFSTNPGGILFDNSAGSASITGAFALGTAAQELVVITNGSSPAVAPSSGAALTTGNALSIGSASSGTTISSGAGALTKAGTGTLILFGNNAYTGNTTINQGAIQMSGSTAALGVLSTAGNQTAIRQGAILDINAAGASTALYTGGPSYAQISIGALTGTGLITNSGAGANTQSSISLGGTATTGTTTFGGTLQDGAGKLNVIINGTSARSQAILGAQSYTGVTVINTGNLAVTRLADGGLASGLGASSNAASNLIFNGGTLTYTGAAAASATTGGGIYQTTQSPSISTDRLFSLAGNATIQSSGTYGNESAAAGTGANNASIIWSNTGDIAFVTNGAKTLTLGGTSIGDNIFRPRITNNTLDSTATALTVSGGLWILNPAVANTYTGVTTISGGQLRAVEGVGVTSTSNLTLSGGVYEVAGTTFARTLGTGAGQVQLTAGNTGFAAGTTSRLVVNLSSGAALTWGSGSFNPATSLVLGSSTALGETELTNAINLGTAARTVTVNNNGNTGAMVTAGILSGVISGGSGGTLTKAGGGVLILGNANTYVGTTTVTSGSLVVSSIGGDGSASSLGSGTGTSGTFIFNPGDSDLNPLIYVGSGETASRNLTLQASASFTTNRNFRIDSSGSGALVWNTGTFANTTRGDTVARVVVLDLRGSNTDNNMMNLVLTDSTNATSPNQLSVAKNDGGTWILNPASSNTFTGAISVGGGNLGLTSNGIGSASGITLSNAGIFAYGGALTTTAPLTLANNSAAVFAGRNAITFNATVTKAAGANDQTISNNLEVGALLTFSGNYVSLENPTAISTRILNIRGYGSTVWNGVIADNSNVATSTGTAGSRTALNIAIDPNASFTLTGSSANTHTGGTTLSDGILIVDKVGAFGAAAFGGTATFAFNGGTLRVGPNLANLTGGNAITNAVTIGGSPPKVDGSKSIEFSGGVALGASRTLQNETTSGAQLIISGTGITNTAASTLTIFGAGNTLISGVYNAGTGASGLTMSGTGTTTLTAANVATGTLTASRGTTTLSGASGAWGAGNIAITAGGTLVIDNVTGGTNNNNRLFDTGTVTTTGGTLNFIGNGTTETTGALTVNSIDMVIDTTGSAGANTLTFASVNFANSGSSLNLAKVGSLGSNNKILFTTSTGLNLSNNVAARVFLGGADFATYNGTNGIVAFSGYAAGTDINTALATDTVKVTSSYTVDDISVSRTLNALSISDTTARNIGVLGGAGDFTLTLTSGGIIADGSGLTHTISVPRLNLGANAFIQTTTGTTLDITGAITSASSVAKALPGTLQFSAKQWYNSTTNVNEGTLILNAGNNTLFPGIAGLNIDSNATVDLKGSIQYVGNLGSPGVLPGTGGTIISSTGGGLLVAGSGNTTWAGTISGTGLSFVRTGGNTTTTLEQAQTYTGSTLVMGGVLALENDATLLNTSAIDLNYAALQLNNNNSLQTQNNNRIGDTIPITLRGGSITYTGRLTTAATETFGAVTLAQGANTITANTGGGTITSVDITFASLTRSNNSTVNFTGTNLGQQGNNSRILFTTPLATTNGGMIGAWAIANSSDYAAYNAGQGIGVVGQGGFVGYDGSAGSGNLWQIPAVAATTTTLAPGTTNAAILRLAGAFTNDIAFTNAGDILNLELGGLLRSDNAVNSTIGTTAIRGVLTSGIGELITYNNQNTITINSVIQGATKLVKDGAGTLTLTAPNTYSLGTVVNRGTLNISPTTAGDVVIPGGGFVINGGVQGTGTTVNLNTSNAIAASTDLTMNGRASLTFAASVNQTLNSVTLNNNGGDAAPTLTVTGTLTLGSSSPVTATSSNANSTATITGGTVALTSASNTFNIAPIAVGAQTYTSIQPTLSIASIITGTGSITKTGTGLLQLSAQNVFNGLTVSSGGIVVGASSTNSTATVVSGPLGIGPVAMAAGTTMLTAGSFSIGNDISFAGSPTFDATAITAWTLTLTGNLTGAGLSGGTPTINVINPGTTVALLGNLPAASSYTKTGLGTLIFNATNYTGNFNATALGNSNLVTLIHDGDRTGSVQTLALGSVIFDSGIVPSITLNRGGSLPFPTASNKILAPSSISNLGLGLTVTTNSGYGLQVSDAIAFTATPTYNVSGTQASNVTQGLYLTGNLTGTGFNKTGSGTMVIANATPSNNTFSGNININQGTVAVNADAQLGNSGNFIVLSPTTGTSAFRATDNITTSRVIQLANTANTRAIEVTNGKTLQLNAAFDLNGGTGATASLNKQDLGTLVINASNSGWSGNVNIVQGAILVNNPALTSPLGTGTISVSPSAGVVGAALQLAGGVTVNNALNLQATANTLSAGINFQGVLDNVSDTNTYAGGIAVPFDSTIGARAGSTLNITGLITVTGTRRLQFNAEGDINATGGQSGAMFGFDKYGSGTLTITTALFGGTITTGGVKVEKGTLVLSGAGTTNSSGAVNIVYQGATMRLDNSGTNTSNRLTARALTLQGGTFDFIANNSTETAGAFVADQGANTINNGGTGSSALTFSTFAGNAGGTLNVTGTFGTATNFLKFTTAPTLTPANTGILNRVTVNGNELATYSASLGVIPFTGYASATNILSATATQTFKATSSTLNSLTGNQTLNALTINNTAAVGGLGGLNPATLTLTSGTIMANGTGGAFLNTPIVSLGAEGLVYVQSGQSLTVNSGMTGTAGLTKSLPGTLNINAQQFVSGTTYINSGSVVLTSTGITNPMLYNQSLAVNFGGTLDLNGNNQFVGGLSSASAGGGNGISGGTVTNNASSQAILTVNGNTNFAGVISGNIYLNKTGTGALNLQSAQTYTGPTLITGGTLTLNDNGALPNTSQPIYINYGGLTLANGNLYNVNNRVNDSAPITMAGGTLSYSGRQQLNSTETLGAITLTEGFNFISAATGGTNVNSAILTLASLSRSAGSAATLRFNGSSNSLGAIGSTPNVLITSAPTLTNNIIGAWAIVDREWASYDSTYGVGQLNQNGFAGYSALGLLSNPTATDNVRFTAAGTTTLVANTTVNTLNFASQTAATVLNLGGNTLTVQGGGILFAQATDNVDFSILNGTITGPSGGGDLYLTHANYGGTNRTVTLNAPIADNSGAIRVIFTSGQVEAAGVGNTIINSVNTYTGGTVINSGNIVLGATGQMGTGGLTVNQAIFTQTAGGIIPSSNTLTLGGASLVNLAGNNTLAGIIVNNLGGSAPTVNPTGVLTLTGGISSTSVNAGNAAVIGTGTIDLNGAASYSINVGATLVNGVQVAPWGADLTINSAIQNGGIVKSGNGILQLGSTASTFTGGVTVNSGGIIIGASSSPSTYSGIPGTGTVVTNGPLGTGTLTLANNVSVVSTAANAVANALTILDSANSTGPGSGTGSTIFNGTNNITFNGVTTLPETWNATVTAPQMTVIIADASPSDSSAIINKYGLGTLSVGNFGGTLNAAGGLIFTADGNTLGTNESLSVGANLNVTSDVSVTVNRSGSAPLARNKNIQQGNLTNNGSILAVQNLNGYGVEFTGTTTLSGASHMSVATATASNVVQGLTLSGVVSDVGGYTLVKSGAGTLALTNSGNTFGGTGATIDILNGIVAVNSDGALGNINNSITLDVDGTTGVGLRATGTFSTARSIILNALNNAMEVTAGNTLTLNTPFSLAAGTGVTFTKNDNGILAINASNSTWTGAITINAGAIQLQNSNALGSGAVTISPAVGAALQLAGGVTYSNPITFGVTGMTGINSGGVIQAVSGTSTFAGLITQTSGNSITIGADPSATLNITGGIATVNSTTFNVGAGGTINLSTVAYGNGAATGNNFIKIGAGSMVVSVASPAASASAIVVSAGTLTFNGAGLIGTGTTANALVDVGATLTLNNSATLTANRLGGSGRTLQLRGGNFNLIGNASNTTEALGAPTFSRGYSVVTVTADPAGQANLTFGAAANNVAPAQNATTGPSGASVLFRGSSLGSAAGAGVATIANSTGGFTFNGQTGAAGTANKGILPWALVDTTATGNGTSFATADTGTANLRPLAASEYNTANTFTASNNINLTSGSTSTGAATLNINSLTMSGGSTATIGSLLQLTSSSGGILVTSGSSTISGGVLNQVNTSSPFNIWTPGTASLTITSLLTGGNGTSNGAISFVKAGAGTLTLSTPQSSISGLTTGVNSLSGQFVINQGTLVLNGGKNTLQANNFIAINGGTLDLNGNSQQVLALFTDGAVNGAGGTITSNTGTGNLVINQDNNARNWAGAVTGSVNLTRSGQNTLTIYSPQTYTGTTLLNGGAITLRDNATLANTTSIDINYATLTADNNTGTIDLTNRINDAAAINLRGGTLALQGRALVASSETVGTVTLAQSNSFISSVVGGGTGINSSDLIIGNLVRTTGGGTVNFTAATGGQIGSSARVILNQINGVSTSTAFAGLTNNIIGGWAVIGTSDFATYVPGLGVAALGTAGALQYSNTTSTPTTIDAAATADNISINVAVTGNTLTVSNNKTLNSLRIGNIAAQTVNIASGRTLTLSSGGLLFFSTASQTIGSAVNQGSITTSGTELFVYAQGTGPQIINSVITGSNVALVKSGSGQVNIAGTNTYGGGTVVNQGTLNVLATGTIPLASTPANGLVINNATVTLNAAGSINSGNVVTLNGGSALNLFGNNTVAGLVFNNIGGTSNPTVTTYSTASATGAGSTGVLTIGSQGIVSTSSNVGTIALIEGRVDFGSSPNTISVGTIDANGTSDIAPLQRAFLLRAIVGSSGGITKSGNGILQLGAQNVFTGSFNVTAGGIQNGVANAGSRFSALTLGSGTRYDLNNASTTWGSLSGSGTIFNSSGAQTLTVGFDNTSTVFSGQIQRFNDATLNAVGLQKIGTGTLRMTGAQSASTGSTGTVTISGGRLVFDGSGQWFTGTTAPAFAGTFTANEGGTLALDNSTTNINNRLGLNATGTLNLNGGSFSISGSGTASTPTTEQITAFNITNGGGRVDLTANASNPLTLTITTLSSLNSQGSAVFTGITGAASSSGVANLVITTPNLSGSQGGGANGTTTMSIRSDSLADPTVGGNGVGFLVKDSVTNNWRALGVASNGSAAPAEYLTTSNTATALAWGATNNVGVSGSQSIFANTPANTLTFLANGTIQSGLNATAFGNYGPGGGLLTMNLSNATALLVQAGFTASINVGNFAATTAGTTPNIHVVAGATLNINGAFNIGGTAGLLKSDGGTLNLNGQAYFTGGNTTVNDGTLNLNSGSDNTLAVVPGATTPTVNALNVNGTTAVVDLNGRNQAVGVIQGVNPLPGMAGTVRNTGAAATLTSTGGGTFSGSITGNIAFTRAGNNTTLLTSTNTYNGATIVRGGTLQLRDSGTISSTAGLTLNYGTLNWDNYGLNPSATPPTRIAAANPVTLQGGTFTINGAGSVDTVVTLSSVTVTGGGNTINTLPYISQGSTVSLTISNLVRNASTRSGVNFNGFTTNNSSAGSNTLGGQGLNTNSNIFLTQLNGTAFSSANLVNGIIGGWAVADGSTFATYSDTFGVVAMGNTYGGFSSTAFTGTDISAATVATGNYNDGTSRTLTTGVKAANSWRLAPGAAQTITPVSGTSWTFGTGIITNANQSITIGAVDATNTLSGTGSDLYFYINQNTTVINAAITGSSSLISNGGATLRLSPQFASNTYTGGTFINAGTTNLQAAAGLVAIPGDLTINNASVVLGNATTGQIASSSNININGGGSLTLFNYTTGATQTLASVNFNNQGGTANPTFAFGTPTTSASTIILTAANAITSTNDSLATTPVFTTGAGTLTNLQLSNAAPVITTSGLSPNSLNIQVVISSAGGAITKSGAGSLTLSGANTFTNGFNLNQGTLIFGAATAGTPPAITSGPVGTGTLTIAGGTTIMSDGTVRSIGNATTINGDFTVGGLVSGNGVTLTGAMNLGAAMRTITVLSPAATLSINSAITTTVASTTGLTKAGAGILTIGVAQTDAAFGGTGTTAGITIAGGILKNGVANAIANSSLITINAGAGYDLNGFGQISKQLTGTGFITNSAASTQVLVIGGTAATDSTTNLNSTFGGVLTDNSVANASSKLALTKSGIGTLTLSGNNNYTGNTLINNGTLQLVGSGSATLGGTAVTVASGATLNISGNTTIGSSTAGSLTVNSGATLSLLDSAVNTLTLANASAGTNLTLSVGGAASLLLDVNAAGNTTDLISVGQKLNLNSGGATVGLNTISGTTLANGTYNLVTFLAGSTSAGSFTFGAGTGSFTFGAGGNVVQIGGGRSYNLTWSGGTSTGRAATSGNFDVSGTGTTALQLSVISNATPTAAYWSGARGDGSWSTILNPSNQTNWLNGPAGTDPLQLPGSISTVYLTANSATNLSTTLDGSFSIAGLVFTGTGTANTAGSTIASGAGTNTLTINASGITVQSGSGNNTISASVILGASQTWTNNSSSSTLTVSGTVSGSSNLTVDGAGSTTISGAINTGTGGVTKNGTGTLNFTAVNTYTGATAVNSGILNIQSAAALGSADGTAGTGTTVASGATLQIQGGITVGNEATTISGPGASGQNAAIVNVGGINNYGGLITLAADSSISADAGTLNLTNTGAITGSGFNLTLTGSGSGSVGSAIATGSGGLTVSGGSTWTLTGTNTYTGNTSVTGGSTLQLGNGGSAGSLSASSAISVAASSTFVVNQSGTVTQGTNFSSSAITGAGNFTKTGSGTTILNADNTYTGATTVSAGTLQVGDGTSGSINSSVGGVSVASGATLSGSGTIAGSTIIGSGAFLAPGNGAPATSNQTLTFTAASTSLTVANGGQIQLGLTTADSVDSGFVAWFNANGGTAADYVASLNGGTGTIANTTWNNGHDGSHDFISASGTILLGSSAGTDARIYVSANNLTGATYGSIFNLIDWSTASIKDGTALSAMGSGSFSVTDNLVLDSIGAGLTWDTSLFNNYGILVVVPEPARMILLMFGLLGIAIRRRRRRSSI
ncbi:autotransporter-associated beta strand repeat-containing protein [Prosthecobacter vanneervenii]|uniref:Autotransporter-associated beta strand protein n=1 Tax=Prosthecobacter vanneervenii TaxID=48466 RepID=A0A7W7Y839_9BACT|nr:autotransporter-associated beta strand repeat-containing protein [Prosthecobacter vanneervenii]MBB5031378.1 autotransporter-associated beta strand protein [Prosthecobacter vanneervenii]